MVFIKQQAVITDNDIIKRTSREQHGLVPGSKDEFTAGPTAGFKSHLFNWWSVTPEKSFFQSTVKPQYQNLCVVCSTNLKLPAAHARDTHKILTTTTSGCTKQAIVFSQHKFMHKSILDPAFRGFLNTLLKWPEYK